MSFYCGGGDVLSELRGALQKLLFLLVFANAAVDCGLWLLYLLW